MNTHGDKPRRADGGGWLHFAAAPIFAAMAVVTGVIDADPARMLCQAIGHGSLSPDGMTFMYLLMAVFHAAPWWKWIVRHVLDHRLARRSCVSRTTAIGSRYR